MAIGENIKKIRLDLKMSQRELGRKINKTGQFISLIEQNRSNPSVETLNSIASALGVTINDLAGNKKTLTQETIEMLIDRGFSLEELSKKCKIPLDDLENMLNNKPYDLSNWRKFLKYIGVTNEQIAIMFKEDIYINSVYNSTNNNKQATTLKKMFLGEPLTLDEVLMNVVDEDRDFITQMYYSGAFNSNDIIKDKANISIPVINEKKIDEINSKIPTIEPLIQFLSNPKIEMVYNFTYNELATYGYEELLFIAIEKTIKNTLQEIKDHENNGDIFDGVGAWISKESPLYEILKNKQEENRDK